MKLRIFSVYDDKAKAFLPPFFLPEQGMAARTFSDCCNSDQHQFGANPADYTLFELGDFNQESGHIEPHPPTSLGNGVIFVSQVTNSGDNNEQTQVGNEAPIQPGAES